MTRARSKGKVDCGAFMHSKRCHKPGCPQILLHDEYVKDDDDDDRGDVRCPACGSLINFWCERKVYLDGPFEGRCGRHRGKVKSPEAPDDIHAANETRLRGHARTVYRQALDMDPIELARSNTAWLAAAAVEQDLGGVPIETIVNTRKALTTSIKEEIAAKDKGGGADDGRAVTEVKFYIEDDGGDATS